jgi:hydrogenase/urease accessory protein HupE
MNRSMTPAAALALIAAAGPAAAHPQPGGSPPSGALEGRLSGLAHPLLGLDHALPAGGLA